MMAGPSRSWARPAISTATTSPPSLLKQPACAQFICRKLFRHFVSETETPSDALLPHPLAAALRDSGYQIEKPVEMILRSNLFFDASVQRRRVKSPVEFAIGTIRSLEILNPNGCNGGGCWRNLCDRMGQSLFVSAFGRGLGRWPRVDQFHGDAGASQPRIGFALGRGHAPGRTV